MFCGLSRGTRAETGPESYALLVGSNQGGAGQRPLAYAERDAERMADLFAQLGRTPSEHITLLRQPTPAELESQLSRLRKLLTARRAAGVKTQVLFYYSGHARAQGLSLGSEELPLERLRSALSELPSTLTVVVLDACQSGTFSSVKGAAPASDFSVSSVHGLDHRGLAVMASSTGSELSQESPELAGSYFTHHLSVALRGAADGDSDGRVSLDESYRYAYQHTLSDTARTQVGMQHATLETNVAGRGDVALTYPADSDAFLSLPAELGGRVLVQRPGRGVVLAELVKAAGAPLFLALPSGRYEVLLRKAEPTRSARECDVTLQPGQTFVLRPGYCREITLPDPRKKGEEERAEEVWFLELGLTGSSQPNDAFTDTLERFRYEPKYGFSPLGAFKREDQQLFLDGAVGFAVHRNLSLFARYDAFERRAFYRRLAGPGLGLDSREDIYEWHTRAGSFGARGRLHLWQEYIVAIADLSVGLAISRSTYSYGQEQERDWHFGPALRAAAGMTFAFNDHFGCYVQGGYAVVRALSNEIGDTHNDGGYFGSFGLRLHSLKGWW